MWDYHLLPAPFAAWLDRLSGIGVPVLNPIELGRWNMDKSYLRQNRGAPRPGEVIAAANRAVGTLQHDWLYARVDGVNTSRGFRLMEFELLEPGLFFENDELAAARFADAVVNRLLKGLLCHWYSVLRCSCCCCL